MTTTPMIDIDATNDLLRRHLDRGGQFRFIQSFGADGYGKSVWSSTDKPLRSVATLDGVRQVYWGVNPTSCTVTDKDRENNPGKTDRQIEPNVASKENTVAAVNALYAEFDAKDETNPTPDETSAQYAVVLAEKQAELAAGTIKALPLESALQVAALSQAKNVKLLTNIPHYKALALQRVQALRVQPSVLVDSGGGYQAYWLLADPFIIDNDDKRKSIKWLQAAWVNFVGADAGAKDLRRILRVPGLRNIKKAYGPNFPVVSYITADFDQTYSIADFEAVLPPRPATEPRQTKAGALTAQRNGNGYHGEKPSAAYNAACKIADVLLDCGYTWVGDRMARPGGKNGTVVIYEDDNESYHHGGEDPLCTGHRVDPFEVFSYYKHGGNKSEAAKDVRRILGMGRDRDNYDGFAHGSPEKLVPQTAAELIEDVQTAAKSIDPSTGEILDNDAGQDATGPTVSGQSTAAQTGPAPAGSKVPPIVDLLKAIDDAGTDAKSKMVAGKMPAGVRDALDAKIKSFDKEIANNAAHAVMIADAIQRAGGYVFDDALLFVQECILSAHMGKERAKGFATIKIKVDKLRNMGHKFRLNLLEDNVEMDGQIVDDVGKSELALYMAAHGIKKNEMEDCLNVLAKEDAYHPIKDYLNGLVWDGKNHFGEMTRHLTGDGRYIDYKYKDKNGNTVGRLVRLGDKKDDANGIVTLADVADTDRYSPLHHIIICRWMIGCVSRALEGDKQMAFKFQTPVLVFVGGQGLGKSAWVRYLVSGVGFDYHRESPLDPHHPEHVRSAVSKWIWEISELGSSLRKADREALKGFITQEWHTYRKPYGRGQITKPTLCNFVGTINNETGFLDDPTGNRRYLPLHITAIDHSYKDSVDINQVWAQIMHLYKSGKSPMLSAIEAAAMGETLEEHEVENPLQGHIQRLFVVDPANTGAFTFTSDIIHALKQDGIALNANAKWAGREVNEALIPLGVSREKRSVSNVKGWGWIGVRER